MNIQDKEFIENIIELTKERTIELVHPKDPDKDVLSDENKKILIENCKKLEEFLDDWKNPKYTEESVEDMLENMAKHFKLCDSLVIGRNLTKALHKIQSGC